MQRGLPSTILIKKGRLEIDTQIYHYELISIFQFLAKTLFDTCTLLFYIK